MQKSTLPEWKDWIHLPVTVEFFQQINQERRDVLEGIIAFSDQNNLIGDYFYQKGIHDGINQVLDILEQIKESD